jgi:hypothetical protein
MISLRFSGNKKPRFCGGVLVYFCFGAGGGGGGGGLTFLEGSGFLPPLQESPLPEFGEGFGSFLDIITPHA